MNINPVNIGNDPIQNLTHKEIEQVKAAEKRSPAAAFSYEPGAGNGFGLQTEAKAAPEEMMLPGSEADAKNRKDMMTLMAHTVSPEAFGRMQEEGFDPAELDPEDAVNITDLIKATMAKSGVVVEGYNDDLGREELEAITGSAAYALEIERAFNERGVPLNEENAKEAASAMERITGMGELTEGAKAYLIENDLTPSIAGLYKAVHSAAAPKSAAEGYISTGGYVGRVGKGTDSGLEEQIRGMIGDAGEEAGPENMALAEHMLEEGLPLTEESFIKMKALEGLELPLSAAEAADAAARALSDGMHADTADLTTDESLLEKAVRIDKELAEIPEEAVDAVLEKDMPLTIRNLAAEAGKLQVGNAAELKPADRQVSPATDSGRPSAITARRQLEEVRLSMTIQVSYRMLKSGVQVETMELNVLVERLKIEESQQLMSRYGTGDAGIAESRAELYAESSRAFAQLPGMPVSILGEFLKDGKDFGADTVRNLLDSGRSRALAYEAAGERYETMATQVRSDLGDSISKAFERAETLLSELHIEAGEENLRAARILGYNSMEITQDNISRVRRAAETVDGIIRRMTPSQTLQMVRDGKNPLEMSMEELDEYLDEAQPEGENYADFLVRMEQKHMVTPEERESFIGIYRMLHQVGKRDGAAIGRVMESGAELSFENLLTAVRSRRDQGMDISVDDSLQGMKAVTRQDIEEQIRTAMAKDAAQDLSDASKLPLTFYQELASLGLKTDADSLLGLRDLRKERGRVFDLAKRAAAGARGREHTASDGRIVSGEEAEHRDSSMSVTESVLEAAMEDALESFTSKADAESAYTHMSEVAERVISESVVSADGSIDVRAYTSAMKQIGTARRMAEAESYELPMTIGGQTTSVSVTVRREGSERGNVEISLEHYEYGSIRGRFSGRQEMLSGYVLCSSRSGRDALETMEEDLLRRMEENNVPVRGINFVYSEHPALNFPAPQADENNSSFDTATLYRAAKTFLESFR